MPNDADRQQIDKSSRRASIGQWWMLLGGGVAWFVQFLVLYGLAEFGSVAGWQERQLLGVDLITWGVLAITLAALAIAGWCSWLAKRVSREIERSAAVAVVDTDAELPSWKGAIDPQFLARSAFMGNAFFAFIIVAQALPVFFF